ncbi:MAG: hypothetical protein ACI9HU_001389 [Colwellia sp.]|jgi:hypothetical protein
MSCKTLAQDIDQSIAETSNVAADNFVFTRNSTAYRIPFSSMIASMGVTGTLNPIGAATSISILDIPSAGINNIRGLAPSQGITATLDAESSIAIKTNFINSGGTAQVIKDTTATQLGFRGITAGDGVLIEQRTNDVLISTTTATTSSNTVIVNSEADFPAAAGGVITLVSGKNYFLASDVSTANRFAGSNSVISSNDAFGTTLTYTGTGDMFTATNGLFGIKEIGIRCPNGTLLNTDAVTSGNLLLRWLLIYEVKNLGSIKSTAIGIYDCFIQLHTGSGFTCGSSSNLRLNIKDITVGSTTLSTAEFIDLGTATFTSLDIDSIIFLSSTAGQVFLAGAASGANINSGVVAVVSKVTINGDMAALSTITAGDVGWDFNSNNKIQDTRPDTLVVLAAQTNTVIATVNTPVLVAGTFTVVSAAQMAGTTAGRATYLSGRPAVLPITANLTIEPVSGTGKTISAYLYKNGTQIAASKVSITTSATFPENISVIWQDTLVTNDYYEIFVENNTDALDIVVRNSVLRVN